MEWFRLWLPTIGAIITLVGLPILAWYGQKLFTTPDKLIIALAESEKVTRLATVNEVNGILSAKGFEQMLKLESITEESDKLSRTLEDIRAEIVVLARQTNEASHSVDILRERLEGFKDLVDVRLKECEDKIHGGGKRS